ncbi:MAG: YqaJ viral recombinase family protein [Polycyclovorans sp.]|nr:YqaJ viral recombinase family protein [Polycyclovorans sp.]
MKTIDGLIQGSPEWAAHRATTRNASDAPVVMGASPYKTRAELVREYATGIRPEVSDATQRLFDRGHDVEPLLRAYAERQTGEDLYPVTGISDDGYLGASFDGVTMLEDCIFEGKLANKAKMEAVRAGRIPEGDYWQVAQQFAVCETAETCMYVCGDGSDDGTVHLLVSREMVADDIPNLIAAWKQFDADVAAYQPEPAKAAPVAAAVEGFGALMLRVEGRVLSTNLDAFKAGAEAFIARLPKPADLQTDQDFVDAIAAVKACEDAEDRIKAEKAAALAQMADVDAVMRAADNISEIIRAARLSLDRVVKAEKDNRKNDLIRGGVDAIRDHYHAINPTVAGFEISIPGSLSVDMGAAIKGLKSLDSMRDKISAAVANAKISASQEADRRRACIALLPDDRSLFPDVRELVATKQPDDLKNLIAARIADHKAREQARRDAERARIRAEEEARAQREADAKADQERQRIRAEEQAKARQEAEDRRRLDAHASAERSATAVESMARSEEPPKYDATPIKSANDDGARIRLGELNALIAPLSISADGLAQLGFEHVATEKAAKLYRASDLPRILGAMSRHLMSVDRLERAA